jgi:4a-hydroxytetrahydrobiopterin dehydratase
MSKLAERRCKDGAKKLEPAKAKELHGELPGWTLAGEELTREVKLKDFLAAIAFVGRVAQIAEAENHHPDIDIRYSKVKLLLTTHDAGGLTENDFIVAAKIDGAL